MPLVWLQRRVGAAVIAPWSALSAPSVQAQDPSTIRPLSGNTNDPRPTRGTE